MIEDGHTGFLSGQLTAHSVTTAIPRALAAFRSKPRLRGMRRSAMARTFGWRESAMSYAALYHANMQA